MITKIKIFKNETYIDQNTGDTCHIIKFGINLQDIPNWKTIVNQDQVNTFIASHTREGSNIVWEVTGHAHLHKGDEFNKDKGEYIAMTKAQMQMHRILVNFFNELNEIIIKSLVCPIIDNADRHRAGYNGCFNHLLNDLYDDKDINYIEEQKSNMLGYPYDLEECKY